MNRRPWIVLLLLVACDSATAPVGDLAFQLRSNNAGLPEITTGANLLEYRSTLLTPCAPYDASARLADRGSTTIEIQVIGRATSDCPQDIIDELPYVARVARLQPASYTLRVIHSWADANWSPDTVFVGPVNIPQ